MTGLLRAQPRKLVFPNQGLCTVLVIIREDLAKQKIWGCECSPVSRPLALVCDFQHQKKTKGTEKVKKEMLRSYSQEGQPLCWADSLI